MWSLGCILAEMICATQPYISKKLYKFKNRVRFQGHYCHPITPKEEPDENLGEHDQMSKILEKCNIDKEKDFSHLASKY